MRCKCGDNILHVGSKLLMYTARKAGVSAEERSQWRPRWSKGLGQVESSPLETDDSLTRSGAAARVPHWMFTSLQVRRCSYWTFVKDNRTTCHANKSQGGDVEIFQLACRVPAFFSFFFFFFHGRQKYPFFIWNNHFQWRVCVWWQRSTPSEPLAGVDRPTIWINSGR